MLTSLKIARFKAVGDSGDLRLDNFNVFIGRNGSGKSSVIEFLELLTQTVEFDLQFASNQFRRGRDVIRNWMGVAGDEASLSLTFDPGDVSAGDSVHYEIGVSAPGNGEDLLISSERLWAMSGETRTDVIRSEEGLRFYRVPATRLPGRVKGQRPPRSGRTSAGERAGTDWIRVEDPFVPAIKHIDLLFSQGGHALRNWLEGALVLRLSPSAVADFAPPKRRRGKKVLDPLGYQTAELLASLSADEREAVLEKLRYVTSGFTEIVSHVPSGPGDQRYFHVTESQNGEPVEIPAWVLSEGTRRLTSMLAVILRESPPPLLCIEEIENGFDPWTLRFVLEELVACAERGTQVMLTTHSPHLMNMIPREVFQFVSRTDGGTEFSRLDGDSSQKRVLDAMGVGDAYVGNLLGVKS